MAMRVIISFKYLQNSNIKEINIFELKKKKSVELHYKT